MYPINRKINRNYDKPFFNRRRNRGRLLFIAIMLVLILATPMIIISQQDQLQYTVLDYAGVAPTATPYAAERAIIGANAYRDGDVDQAAYYFALAVTQQPQNLNYMYEYGLILIEQDRNQQAAELAEQMIELEADNVLGYALKAQAIAWQSPTDAIPAAIEGREINDQFAPIWGALAIAYTRIGRYTEALRAGDYAITLDPMNASVRRSYSLPLVYTGNYSEAIRQYEQAIALNPNLVAPYFELAFLYKLPQINEPDISLAIYNRILEIEPDNEQAYLRICETYAFVGKFQEAEAYCDTALEIDPNYLSAHRMRGQSRYSRRNYEGAIESFQVCYLLYAEQQLNQDIINPIDVEEKPNINIADIEAQIDVSQIDMNQIEIECLYIRGLAHYFLADCEAAWQWLNIALNHPSAVSSVQQNITQGLARTQRDCAGFANRTIPTPIPPTPIPPTPIGGF